ncbi:integrase core domain-containing protein [Algisphaera agarilytica]|uniref:Integrase catalytic domain-containing protein n=1 Tax=Algisphaera agarilytica TaxID=1385975 RepID=A0A7X0LJU0_9BACT|nr:integrase core domain-containing protein [Algisphaera agarilytica]MBB6429119.1 hypothetical protein [Algisphaera agarilytica]
MSYLCIASENRGYVYFAYGLIFEDQTNMQHVVSDLVKLIDRLHYGTGRLRATHLIHDRDTKFTDTFGALFENSSGIDVVKSPVRAPNANAYAESWISTIKRECLDYFACFSLKHSDFLVQTFGGFYNDHRPHQSLGNRTLDASDMPSLGLAQEQAVVGKIGCRSELGGLLKHYYRSAA